MDITPLVPKGKQVISRYGDGGFVVNDIPYRGNILLLPDRVVLWPVESAITASAASLAPLFEAEPPEIVLIGAGSRFARIPPELKIFFREKGASSDCMDTGAACRTYSVLLTEGRLVSAALIAV